MFSIHTDSVDKSKVTVDTPAPAPDMMDVAFRPCPLSNTPVRNPTV